MRRLALALFVLASLALGSCGDDESSDAPVDTAGAAEVVAGGTDADACAAAAEASAATQATTSFPDNPDVTWVVAGTEADAGGRATVEVVPTPDEVGYPRFRLVSQCDAGTVVLLGTYALDDGAWVLLFTTDAPGAAELPLELT